MGLSIGTTGRNLVIIDAVESWNGLHNVSSGNPNGQLTDFRSSVDLGAGGSTAQLFASVSGAVGALAFDVNLGRVAHVWTSLAAISSITQQTGAGGFGVPMYQRFTSPVVKIPAAFYPRPFRKYRIDYLCRGIVGPGAADCAMGIAANNGSALVTGGALDPFVAWVSRNGLNGGRWTPRYRLTAGGAFVEGTDSGVAFIDAAAMHQLSIEYAEGFTPRITWFLDGRQVFQLAGDANMPAALGSSFCAKAMGATAGATQAQWAESRFRVTEIG